MIRTDVMRNRFPALAISLLAALAAEQARAEVIDLAMDGWHTWRVAAADNAPDWCCFQWNRGIASTGECDLDGRQINYGSSRDNPTGPGEMQIYALVDDGSVVQIRTMSPSCPVKTRIPVFDLGAIDGQQSINWLEREIAPKSRMSSHALAAISVHERNVAIDTLVKVIENRGASNDNRKQALFWLANTDSNEAFAYLDRVLSQH